MIAAKLANMKNGSNQHRKEGSSIDEPSTRDDAAKLLNVSRNITPDQFRYFLGWLYNRTKKAVGGTGANQHKQRDQIDPSAKTADKLADDHGVSPATVKRAGINCGNSAVGRRMGEMLAEIPKHNGRPEKKGDTKSPLLSDFGISKKQSSRWQTIYAAPEQNNTMLTTRARIAYHEAGHAVCAVEFGATSFDAHLRQDASGDWQGAFGCRPQAVMQFVSAGGIIVELMLEHPHADAEFLAERLYDEVHAEPAAAVVMPGIGSMKPDTYHLPRQYEQLKAVADATRCAIIKNQTALHRIARSLLETGLCSWELR